MSTELEAVTTEVAKFDAVAAGIKALQETYTGVVYPVATTQGMADAKAARAAIREPRYEVEKIRKAAKAPILALGKSLDDRAKRITAALEAIEAPIDQQIKAEEDRKEAERQAKIDAELARVASIQDKIESIRALPVRATGKPSAQVAAIQAEAAAIVIDASYQEFAEQAGAALAQSVAALAGLHAGAVAAEAEAARVAAEREELTRLRAEQEQRDRVERERLAEEGRKAREAQAAEVARQQAELAAQRAEQERAAQVERDRLAAERAEQDRLAKIERDRQAAEQAKLDQQRAELVAEQDRARKQRDAEEAAKQAAKRPTDDAIIAALAEHFKVTPKIVRTWLGWEKRAAA